MFTHTILNLNDIIWILLKYEYFIIIKFIYFTRFRKRYGKIDLRNVSSHWDLISILPFATSRRDLLEESMSSALAKMAPEIWYANPPLPDNARYQA